MHSHDSADYSRLKQAYCDLLELDDVARAHKLRQWEQQDPALGAALRRQLQAAAQPVALLDRRGDTDSAPQLPNYRLIRELGRGGMGVVWLAERALEDARQRVALKRIAGGALGHDDRLRFQRERRILASLDHPHIAALVDGGNDARGIAWLATQYVDGERLDRWCEQQQLPLRARVALLREVTAAVAYAHGMLVVHRDLKPANILVTRDGTPKLLDFGIARALHEEAVTSEGPSQMTLRYAAPEQVASDGSEAGVSVDIYALGVLLYELAALRSPYESAASTAALMHAVLHASPLPPSRNATALPGLDADLDAICLKALRKRPQDRYASAGELLAELDRWLAREPVEARRGERGYRLRSTLRRRWPWLAAGVLITAAVAYHLHVQDLQLALAERQRDKAQALADHFGRLFAEATPADTERGDVSARALLERSVASLGTDRTRPPATRAALLLASADALDYLGQTRAALVAVQEAMRLALALDPADHDLLANAHSELASLFSKTGDNLGAQREAAAGLALYADGRAQEPEVLRALRQQAAIYAENAGDRDGARRAYEAIAAAAREEFPRHEALESYLATQVNLATGEPPEQAEPRLADALAVAAEYGFADPSTLVPMRAYLAQALFNQRRITAARAVMEPNLVDARAYYGADDPWLGMILSIAGNLAALDGDAARADALLAESGRVAEKSFGPEHPNTRSSEADRAVASVLAEDWPEAERRLAAILGWMQDTGKGQSRLARYLRGAQAYVRARREPSLATIDAALQHTKERESWGEGRYRWTADDWNTWLQHARDQAGTAASTAR
jgi:eukaryotic-like serine/threonine-protein kinase